MILYFANRKMDILGMASTDLDGVIIDDDVKQEDIETGVVTFSCDLIYEGGQRLEIEDMTEAGNYLLRSDGQDNEFYTIISTSIDTAKRTVSIEAEDAGLDLLNTIALEYKAPYAMYIKSYINKWIVDSGFTIGINEIPTYKRTLKWEGESTVSERLASVANSFGAEINYSFEIEGLRVKKKYINIYRKRGKSIGEELRLGRNVENIRIKKTIENLATALYVKGGIPKGRQTPISLYGYHYDDGDFYVSGKYLKSRKAVAKWSRYLSETGTGQGHIERTYSYDTTSQKTLCSKAVGALKKICDTEVNYEVDIIELPENTRIGDRVNVVDNSGELYLSARILSLETSVTAGTHKATLGEYLIKSSGISDKVHDLASQFADRERELKAANILRMQASATNGNILTQDVQETTLKANLYSWDEDITAAEDIKMDWTRKTGNAAADDEWNAAHQDMKEVTVTPADVDTQALFTCAASPVSDPPAEAAPLTTFSDPVIASCEILVQDSAKEEYESIRWEVAEKADNEVVNEAVVRLAGDIDLNRQDIVEITGSVSAQGTRIGSLTQQAEDLDARALANEKSITSIESAIKIDETKPSITLTTSGMVGESGTSRAIEITSERIEFLEDGTTTTWIAGNSLSSDRIYESEMLPRARQADGTLAGQLGLVARTNGHLSIKVMRGGR